MKDFLRVIKALSEPSRVKIVKMLQRRTMCVCELQEALGIAQSSVSKHLKILEDAGIVDHRRDGLWVNYSLTDGGRSPYVSTLVGSLRHWLEDDPEVRALAERLPHIRREEICCKRGA
jgi:ArsR family transcriptional regulator, arsenate/arsenite/antimonite-responsive transcriptional repressor